MFGIFDSQARLNELAEKGKTARLLRLVAKGADINQRNSAGYTPLLSALSALPFAHRETADALIAAGADVNCRRHDGRFDDTPLLLAAQKGFSSTVELLLKAGAEVNAVASGTTALIAAAARNHTHVVSMLLTAGATVHHRDIDGRSALFYAYLNKNEDIVKILLAAGASLNLPEAAECGQTEQVRRLLEIGADVNEGAPIVGAAAEEHSDIVGLLIAAGADIDAQDIAGNTALHHAARWGNTDIAKQLLAAGADANIANDDEETPFTLAVRNGQTECLRLLLAERKCEHLNSLTQGTTLLHMAVDGAHAEIASLLIEAGADLNRTNVYHKETPLTLAQKLKRKEIANILRAAGAI